MLSKLFTITSLATVISVGALAQQTIETVIMPRGSEWKYSDNGLDLGTAWYAPNYNDSTWLSGRGELGYGDGDEITTVGHITVNGGKNATTYFRSNFQVAALPTNGQKLGLKIRRDDGVVVYINGREVMRDNMPAGVISYTTFASTTIDGANEAAYVYFQIPDSSISLGNNVVAVEVHQDRAQSSDISFDFEVVYSEFKPPVECNDIMDSLHISQFVSVIPTSQPDSIRIPSTHTFQMIVQQGDAYSDSTNGVTKGLFDFTGYVPKNGSSTDGWLSINHELGSWPAAGVSMLTLGFDTANSIWNVTNNVPVDFGPVAGTGRNCSGTVTPWGTIITSEETLPTSDVNGDGFQDIGWNVEIDPATAKIVDHHNNGRPEKLWKLGRMSHENVVVNPWDRKTVYEGNDENPGYIFRFIADQPEDLTSGQLYVLKLDGPLGNSTTGQWIGIPNSTPADCNNSRSFASAVGATNFNQIEDVEISPLDSMIYFTSKASSRVYRFKDEGTRVSKMEVFVGNSSSVYNIKTEEGIIPETWGGGVDNLTFDSKGNLYVIQDGSRNHIYMVPPCHTQTNPAVKLFMVTPAGSEPTGMTMTPDDKFMFVSIQHPSSSNATEQLDAAGKLVKFNRESAIVIGRKEFLGPLAIKEEPDTDTTDPTSVRNVEKAINVFNAYPNPTTGNVTLNVDLNAASNAIITVTTVNGTDVRLISRKLNEGTNLIDVDMNNLPAGVYFASIKVNGSIQSIKILKQ